MLKTVLQVVIIFIFVLPIFSIEVNFDQGIDLPDFIEEAHKQSSENKDFKNIDFSAKTNTKQACDIHFKAPPLTLQDNIKFVRARYDLNEKCEPNLTFVEYLEDIPPTIPVQEPATQQKTTGVLVRNTSNPIIKSMTLEKAYYTCNVTAWEQEVVHMKMIQVENKTNWTTDFSDILNVNITAISTEFWNWWYLFSGPFARSWWVTQFTHAHTLAQAAFYCNGGPFCLSGPMYYMTIKAHTDIFSSGICQGIAEFDGQLVPGGSVYYTVSR